MRVSRDHLRAGVGSAAAVCVGAASFVVAAVKRGVRVLLSIW